MLALDRSATPVPLRAAQVGQSRGPRTR